MKNLYSLTVVCASIVFGVAAAPSLLAAQAEGQTGIQMIAMQPTSVMIPGAAPATSVGPTAATAAFHTAQSESRVVADQDVGPHVNRGFKLMVAGIAAVGVGYAVKGKAGTAIALGGGALAVYGLYHWIE